MRVVVLTTMFPSSANAISGIFVEQQVRALQRQGIEVQVIAPRPYVPRYFAWAKLKWRTHVESPDFENFDGLAVHRPRYIALPRGMHPSSAGNRIYMGVAQSFRKICSEGPIDLIHAHAAFSAGVAAARLSKRYSIPYVVTIHGQDLQHTIRLGTASKDAVIAGCADAAKVIVVSSKLASLLSAAAPDLGPATVIANGIDECDFVEAKTAAPTHPFPHVVSVSNLIESKGIEYNLRAVSRLSERYANIHYTIVGDGPDRNRLEGITRNLGIDSNVSFLGQLAHADAIFQIAAADVFSLPSWEEGFGIAYLEAMACGKPVIACVGQGIQDVISHGSTGLLVEGRNAKAVEVAIDSLVSDRGKSGLLAENGRRLALSNYTWAANARKTQDVYESVLRDCEKT